MASVTFRTMNRNRLKKVYPHTRKTPRNVMISDKEIIMETASVSLTDSNSGSYTFTETYNSIPVITLGAQITGGGIVNVFITDLNTQSVTFQTSAEITGTVYIQVLQIGS